MTTSIATANAPETGNIKFFFFFKMRFIMQVGLMSLSFSSLLVCFKFCDSCIIQFSFTQTVAQKQWQMFLRLEKSSFFQNKIYHASYFDELVIDKYN